MKNITRDDLLKVARLSSLELNEAEIPTLIKHINDVLRYASRVQEAVNLMPISTQAPALTNITRPDTVIIPNPQEIRACFPQEEQNFIVVPHILEGQ